MAVGRDIFDTGWAVGATVGVVVVGGIVVIFLFVGDSTIRDVGATEGMVLNKVEFGSWTENHVGDIDFEGAIVGVIVGGVVLVALSIMIILSTNSTTN
jgi:hypothetical protein